MDFRNHPVPYTYRPDIDGLRTVAVLSVLIYHLRSQWLPGGFVGVDIFFVISGFVVTASLAQSNSSSLSGFIGAFYARRLARILPALVTSLVVTALAATAFIPLAWLSELSQTTALYAFVGLSNWAMQQNTDTYFAPRSEFNPYMHTWSLGIEEQFYLVAPLMIFFWVRASKTRDNRTALLAIGGLSSAILASIIGSALTSGSNPNAAFYFIGNRFWELGLGALGYMLLQQRPVLALLTGMPPGIRNLISIAGTILIGIALTNTRMLGFPFPWAWLPVLGTLLLVVVSHVDRSGPLFRILASAPAVWIGKRSYSLYLWHWPIYVLMRWTVGLEGWLHIFAALFMTFLAAMISYRMVETPLRHNQAIESWPTFVRIAAFMMLTILGFLFTRHVFDNAPRYSLSRVTRASTDWYPPYARLSYPDVGNRICDVTSTTVDFAGGTKREFSARKCPESAGNRIFVLGDSHAGHIAGMLEQASAETGHSTIIYSGPGCGFLVLSIPMGRYLSQECLSYHHAAVDDILKSARPGDLLLLSTLRLMRFADQYANFGIRDMFAHMYNADTMPSRDAAVVEAKEWLRPFSMKGLKISFVAPTPMFNTPHFRCADWFNRMNPICIPDESLVKTEFERLRLPVINGMRQIAQDIPGVDIWDPLPILCPDDQCRLQLNGRPLFFDTDHISGYGNLLLYPDFVRYLHSLRESATTMPVARD